MTGAAESLRRLIDKSGGDITVEQFMQFALYHPEWGYYSRTVETVGARGDFSTSATLHPAFGEAIAAWVRDHAKAVRHGWQWHVIELGAGTGELAANVLRELGWVGRLGLRYHIVEVSAGLRAAQARRLGTRVQWHGDIRAALRAAGGRALIFSNEFVDAFPCEQLALDAVDSGWRTVRVRWANGAPESFVAEGGAADGQRIERHSSYRRWLLEWAPLWRAGRMLTIDYGDGWPQLYDRRPRGTLRAYWRQQRIEGPEIFARVGQQDLTADVNFTDLAQWGAEAGLQNSAVLSQAEFLRRWLPVRAMQRASADPALAFLLDADGAGGAFKTLEQWPKSSDGERAGSGVHLSPS